MGPTGSQSRNEGAANLVLSTNAPTPGGKRPSADRSRWNFGRGKKTIAKALAAALALLQIVLDALNWEADRRDLSQTNPDEFVRRVTAAIAANAWCSTATTASCAIWSGAARRT
jgi:hypothetical protein